jgi:hypothetical protein
MLWLKEFTSASITETELACDLGFSLNSRKQKTHYIAVTGFFNLNPGNVVVPTAVESQIANTTLSLVGLVLELFV